MKNRKSLNPIVSAIGATFVVSLAASPVVNANTNPFAMNDLHGGFMVAEADVQKCGSLCGGANPKLDKNGEMIKCGNVCGEVAKCGSICGGVTERKTQGEGGDHEIAKCGNICAATK